MLEGLKHFAVVGLGFALIGGWILTLIANTLLGTLLEMLLQAPPTNYYLTSALLTVVSISLIAVRGSWQSYVSSAIPLGTLRVSVAFHFRNAVLGGRNCIRLAGVLARADAVREQHTLFSSYFRAIADVLVTGLRGSCYFPHCTFSSAGQRFMAPKAPNQALRSTPSPCAMNFDVNLSQSR